MTLRSIAFFFLVKLHSFLSCCALTDITLSLYRHFPDVPSKLNASTFVVLNAAQGNAPPWKQ
jgi:hypothetical protein